MNHKKPYLIVPGGCKNGSDLVATRMQAEALLNIARDCKVQNSTIGMDDHAENTGRGCIQFWHTALDCENNGGLIGAAFQKEILVRGEKQPELNKEFIVVD